MKEYNIIFYNNMGNLLINNYDNLPTFVTEFAYKIINNKIIYATDKQNLGCVFYILKPELLNKWSYNINNIKINIDYSKLDKFDFNNMKYI